MMEQGHMPGDVFQIIEAHGRKGWIGAFVLATEIKAWGIQGFVVAIETHDEQRRAYIRLGWKDIEYVGRAVLMPKDDYAAPQAEPRLKGPGRSDGCVDSIAETASPADAAPTGDKGDG